jgi:hypothetical protein
VPRDRSVQASLRTGWLPESLFGFSKRHAFQDLNSASVRAWAFGICDVCYIASIAIQQLHLELLQMETVPLLASRYKDVARAALKRGAAMTPIGRQLETCLSMIAAATIPPSPRGHASCRSRARRHWRRFIGSLLHRSRIAGPGLSPADPSMCGEEPRPYSRHAAAVDIGRASHALPHSLRGDRL